MALPNPKTPSVEQVLRLVDQLTPEEQEELRQQFLEDQEDIRICQERLENPGKLWSLEELEQEVDLAS